MAQASITFYKVTECGYFQRDGDSKPLFGTLPELLQDFMAWAKDGEKKLGDTCTYHLEETSNLLRTFCYDCLRDDATGDVLLVVWNETSSVEGNVPHVQEDAEVGNAEIAGTPLPTGAIPGFPTYFWFIPSRNAYATVKFESPLNGNEGMRRLLKEFAAKFGEHCVSQASLENPDTIEVLGYRSGKGSDVLHLYPRFRSELARQPGFYEYITASRSRIQKMVRKNLLLQTRHSDGEDSGLFSILFDKLLGGQPEQARDEVHVTYEMDVTPTEQELQTIISSWTAISTSDSRTRWDDVGFQLRGDTGKVHWLSHSNARLETILRLTEGKLGTYPARDLFDELLINRASALSILNNCTG